MRTRIGLLAVLLCASTAVSPVRAEDAGSNVLFIFDSSGSMKRTIESGETRSQAAKRAMVAALSEMPASSRLGLLMYGHRRAKDCTDIELISPIGTADGAGIAALVLDSTPKGETPIAAALERAAQSFAPLAGDANSIVLVTDGIEECAGDPCAAARAIRAAGVDLKVHVVGFTLDAQQRQTLQCVADETGGAYFDAQNAEGLSEALNEVRKQVVEVTPPPAPPQAEAIFADDFDGAALQPHWRVVNGTANSHVVEDGKLLLSITRTGKDSAGQEAQFNLDGVALPAGDWTASAIVELGVQTALESFAVSLASPDTTISAQFAISGDKYYGWKAGVRIEKTAAGEVTGFDQAARELGCNVCGEDRMLPAFAAMLATPFELQLVKEGRSFHARLRAVGAEEWTATDKVTSLKSGGALRLSGFLRDASDGESYAFVDRFEILSNP